MTAQQLVPGDRTGTTAGPYMFLRRIGVGGMGEVWYGEDRRLSREVALKVIRPDLFDDPATKERFVREARHASSVVHPYVATVFDVIATPSETILVMEYVEGTSLQDVIFQAAPPPIDERLGYGVEIAEALEAIHSLGILHRDLKPGNVIVTSAGHVKVLDLGLAGRAEPLSGSWLDPDSMVTTGDALTGPGHAVGTISYMSPEQIRGEKLDVRSDVFSLGIILCELATTHHPFARESVPKTIGAILEAEPFSRESGTDSITPAGLQPVLARALSKSRGLRYASARELADDLRLVLRGETANAVRIAFARRLRRARGKIAGTALAVAVAVAGVVAWLRTPPNWNAPRVAVAFVALDDRTGTADGAVRASMVADLIATDLASSRIVRPIGPDETRPILAGMAPGASGRDVAQRLAAAMNVDYVARGILYKEGDRYVATLEAIPTRGGLTLASMHAEGATATALAQSLAGALRRAMPGVPTITAVRDHRGDLAALTSQSEDARMLFERGQLAWRDGRVTEAIDFLDRAIVADPDFALARATLAQVRHEAGYGRLAREEADRARARAPTGDSPSAERLRLTLDAVRAEVSEDAASFAEAAGKLAAKYGDEPETMELLARALGKAGKKTEALAAVDRAISLDGSRPSLSLTRAEILADAERWDDALAAIDTADRIYTTLGSTEGRANAERLRGGTLMQAQRHEAAIASLNSAIVALTKAGRQGLVADATSDLAGVYLLVGRPGQAEPLLASSATQARAAGNLGLACDVTARQGAQAFIQGDYAVAETRLRDAVDQARFLQNDGLLTDPLSNLTSLLSFTGRYAETRAPLEELMAAVTRSGRQDRILNARLNLANLDLMQGRLDDATKSYDEVLRVEGLESNNQNGPWARLGRAELLQGRGRLGDALTDANAAVTTFDRLGATGFAGYARLRRGLVAMELGRTKDAAADFDAADREAHRDPAGLADLAARVELARDLIDATRKAPGRPSRTVEAAVASSAVFRAGFAANRCETFLLHGDASRADTSCRSAVDDPAAQALDVMSARSSRAESLLQLRRWSEARDEARLAFDDSSRLGLLLPAARAAGVLVRLTGALKPSDTAVLGKRGLELLDAYVEGVPSVDRDRINQRAAISRLRRTLQSASLPPSTASISPPRPVGG